MKFLASIRSISCLFILLIASAACSHYTEKNPPDPSTIVPQTVAWQQVSSQLFDQRCSICHGQGGDGINTTDYQSVLDNLAKMENEVFKKKSMPPDSPLTPYEQALLTDWINNRTPYEISGNNG